MVMEFSIDSEALEHSPEEPENWVKSGFRVGAWPGIKSEGQRIRRSGAERWCCFGAVAERTA